MSHDDDQPTLLGPDSDLPAPHNVEATVLPVGARVQEFQIEGLVGEGGFSVVYRARDTLLGRTIALKEYLPASLAHRNTARQVQPRTARQRETFELGLRSFMNEARLLASFDHPALVKVYRFWEENGTAYLVMPLYQGQTLRTWVARERGGESPFSTQITQTRLLQMLLPLLDALEVMHNKQCYHRDIAPDNILLLDDDEDPAPGQPAYGMRPVLLDFGAARRVISDATQTLTVILKPGYAPIEQYAESAHSRQGPWTDIYALCATLYYTVTGRVPDPSVSRVVHDDLKPAHTLDIDTMSPSFLALIDQGMAVRPEHRPQSVQVLRALLLAATTDADEAGAASSAAIASSPARGHFDPEATVIIGGHEAAGSVLATGDALIAAAGFNHPTPPAKAATPAPAADTPLQPPPSKPRRWLPAAGAAVIAVTTIVTWQLLREPTDIAHPAEKKPSLVTAASPEAPSPAPPSPQAQGDSSATTTPTTELTSPIATSTRVARAEPFSVLAALQDIAAGADAQLTVSAQADKPRLIIGTDKLSFKVQSSEAGHIYVYASGTHGNEFVLLFPNAKDRNNRIQANKPVRLPREAWLLEAAGPPGTNHLLVVVSRSPRDFKATGLITKDKDIPEWNYEDAIHRWATRGTPAPGAPEHTLNPFIGTAACGAKAIECPAGYGAALLDVDEVEGKK